MKRLREETVDKDTLDMIHAFMRDQALKDFYLVGGTALSLQMGHRISVDIDLFTHVDFDKQALMVHMERNYDPNWQIMRMHGIECFPGKEKVDFYYYPAPPIRPLEIIEGIRMMSIEDIAAMKMNALLTDSQRVKDLVDIYAVLEKVPFSEVAIVFARKYPEIDPKEAIKKIAHENGVAQGFGKVQILWKDISAGKVLEKIRKTALETDMKEQANKKPLLEKKPRNENKNKGRKL